MRLSLVSVGVLAAVLAAIQPGSALAAPDGFTAYCTGNLDGTGDCFNQESNQRYTCVVIPGQVIDCKSKGGTPFQCVWISGVQSNQAEFWCDPSVDAMLANEISANTFRQRSVDPLMQRPSEPAELRQDVFGDVTPSDFGNPFAKPALP
jgi:hypothetical protein